ncbi:hypothetical protein E2562_036864 [Oryza meyeriana var. granulata]|uniref:Uncharacterized protein n=1 Tax=Oryza meyeriana var. granulata TaxID=110450 RepID=A0A6G1ECK6_9ORYZ|nr:hypothetical protein E2562_036864 [Oryza meyeriana var. granulata]
MEVSSNVAQVSCPTWHWEELEENVKTKEGEVLLDPSSDDDQFSLSQGHVLLFAILTMDSEASRKKCVQSTMTPRNSSHDSNSVKTS